MAKLPWIISMNLSEDVAHKITADPKRIFSEQKRTIVEEVKKNSWLIKKKGRIIRGPGYILHKIKDEKNLIVYELESKGKRDVGYRIEIGPGKKKPTEVKIMPFSTKSKIIQSEFDSATWWSYFQFQVDMIMGLLPEPLLKVLREEEKAQRQGKK